MCHGRYIVVLFAMSLLSGSGCSQATHDTVQDAQTDPSKKVSTTQARAMSPELMYHLAISSPLAASLEKDFNDDSHLELGCSHIGGSITLFVNGSPIDKHEFGALITPIHDLVVPGKNEIVIEGEHNNALFAKVLLIDPAPDPFVIHKVVARKILGSHSKRSVLEFTSDVDDYPVYDELHLKDDASERESLERYINNLLALWRQHKGEQFHELWHPKLEGRVRGRSCQEDIPARNGKIVDRINDAKYVLTTTAQDLTFIYGTHTVLCLCGLFSRREHVLFHAGKESGSRVCARCSMFG